MDFYIFLELFYSLLTANSGLKETPSPDPIDNLYPEYIDKCNLIKNELFTKKDFIGESWFCTTCTTYFFSNFY
jgi:hypothetical protein